MKQLKRSGMYKAANVTFDPTKVEAHSYDWWQFVKVVSGKVVFNEYRYSNTTTKHQWKVRRLMYSLGINIDLIIQTASSLEHVTTLKEIKRLHREELEKQVVLAEAKRVARNREARERREKNKAQQFALAQDAKRVLRLV